FLIEEKINRAQKDPLRDANVKILSLYEGFRPLLAIAICFALMQQIALILTVSKLDWLRQLLHILKSDSYHSKARYSIAPQLYQNNQLAKLRINLIDDRANKLFI
ncbi:hypothetical protein BpHYR1_033176, partial [Brachionus plicatilis]